MAGMGRFKGVAGALLVLGCWLLGVLTSFGIMAAAKSCERVERNEGVKEKFEEFEFVVIHRPHLTYFMDVKYLLCFATRKPNYQDLVKFHCPERLWREVEAGLKGKLKLKLRPEGTSPDGGKKEEKK